MNIFQINDLISFLNNFNMLNVKSVKKDVGAGMLVVLIGNVTAPNARKDIAGLEYWSVASNV